MGEAVSAPEVKEEKNLLVEEEEKEVDGDGGGLRRK